MKVYQKQTGLYYVVSKVLDGLNPGIASRSLGGRE